MFPELFTGKVGLYKNFQVKLHIDESIKPRQEKLRHIPFHLREKVEVEMKNMVEQDLIEPVIGPTPWVSPIVPVPKGENDSEIRICTDARGPNEAILRERHQAPTVDDLVVKLNGAAVISKLDLKSGYNQIMIDQSSRYITAFFTHMGIFQYKRLNFGINTAAEIFHKTIENLLAGVDGVVNMSDDIIISGKTQKEHDVRLEEVMKRLVKSGLTLNEKKCVFSTNECDFFGLHFSKEGITTQISKIEALKNASSPKNVSELRSILGLAQYCGRSIEQLATLTQPLRELTKSKTKWNWTNEHEEVLDKLKESLTTVTMAYFNKNWRTEQTVDASPVGLGVVMAQYNPSDPNERKIVQYASKSLTVEGRYSQVEKEALAVV